MESVNLISTIKFAINNNFEIVDPDFLNFFSIFKLYVIYKIYLKDIPTRNNS